VIGRSAGDVLVPEAQRSAFEGGLSRAAAGPAPEMPDRFVRLSALRSDGREMIVDLFATRTSQAPARFTAWIREPSGEEADGAVGSWVWVPPKDHLRWSENLYRIFGLSPDDVAPDPDVIVDLSHPDDRERLRARMHERTVLGDVSPTAYRIVRPDGEVRHLLSMVTVTERENDAPYRIVGFLEDTTERIRARRATASDTAVDRVLSAWTSFQKGAEGLLAGLADALECQQGILWLPFGNVLVARTVWGDETARGARLLRGDVIAWKAHTRRQVATARRTVAIPAVAGEQVLAVVELRSRDRLELSSALLRSLTELGRRLGAFLQTRQDELGTPLLTPRELEVLSLAARGLAAKQIAEQLEITRSTVGTHLEHVYSKLGVSDRAAAVATAIRLGLIG
jgi:PAS domain S-box-containing protein